jgi:hypothetical protein
MARSSLLLLLPIFILTFSNHQLDSCAESDPLYSKEIYEIQYKEKDFIQVAKTSVENKYGSTKETQIYYHKGNRYFLISRKEYTEDNILPNQ